MKKIYINGLIGVLVIAFFGCTNKLEEENHSKLTPDFFATQQGVDYGLNAAYAGLRTYYGTEEGMEAFTIGGTDEFYAPNGARVTNADNYNSSYTSSNETSKMLWNTGYTMINTCNGIVDFGTSMTGISDAVKKVKLGEARFLRAFYYFKLVQFYGDVTLNKNYLTTPTTSAKRDSKADVYDFIINDLKICITDLPASPKTNGVQVGRATAVAAKHLLALVYLTRGWSNVAQTSDFQNAFDMAKSLIDTAPTIGVGLQSTFAQVVAPLNENNSEVLFNVQFSTDLTYGSSHVLNHLFVTGYHALLGDRSVIYGRPYSWYRGNNWMYNTAFADKVNDTRYNATFQKLWIANIKDIGYGYTPVYQTFTINGVTYKKQIQFHVGDTALYLPGYNLPPEQMMKSKYYVYTPEIYTNTVFPTMTKYLDPNRATANENSHRPIIIFRLADTYLIAAEAALKLNKPDIAANYINIVRRRAAASGKNIDIQPSDVTVDFILDERTRELCAECMRWLDLVRTGKLVERVQKYEDWEGRKNIQTKHILRPVPQSQIDAVITGTPYPQNTGW